MSGDRSGQRGRFSSHHASPYQHPQQQPPLRTQGTFDQAVGSPHRYEVQQQPPPASSRCYPPNTGSEGAGSSSMPRSLSSQNMGQGLSGSRGGTTSASQRTFSNSGAQDPSTPYSAQRSPTQLRYFEDQRTHGSTLQSSPNHNLVSPSAMPSMAPQYSTPPPFQRASSGPGSAYSQQSSSQRPTVGSPQPRGQNVFDQDNLAEVHAQQRAGYAYHARPNSTVAATSARQPGQGYAGTPYVAGGYSPPTSSAYYSPFGAPLPNTATIAASVRHTSQRSASAVVGGNHRIHFFDQCNAIVEERDLNGMIRATYRCGSLLGTGGFAKVFDFIESRTAERYACKVIDKVKLTEASKRAKLAAEIDVHRRMHHPNILRFIRHFQDEFYHYILLERCCRLSLMDLSRTRGTFAVDEVQYIMLQLLQGVDHMHQNRVIHRDLKLGNVMIDAHGNMKIGDFGFATELRHDDERKRTMCGTPNYIAPEILTANDCGGYSYEADIWSLGVILYALMVGVPPFETSNLPSTYSKIKRCEYGFPGHVHVHDSCRHLIGWMLQRDPRMRPSAVQIRNHSFFRSPEAPRYAPSSLVGLDPELAHTRDAPSPYAEAGRSSSPIQNTFQEANSPLMAHTQPVMLAPQEAHRAAPPLPGSAFEFTPPPAYNGPQPTPYHFSATPPPPGNNPFIGVPSLLGTPQVARPLYTDVMEMDVSPPPPPQQRPQSPQRQSDQNQALRKRISSFLREETRNAADAAARAREATVLPSSTSSSNTTVDNEGELESKGEALQQAADHFDTSTDDESVDMCPQPEDATPTRDSTAPPCAPPAPRIFFTEMVHFPRYGYGFVTWDQRDDSHQKRTKAVGAYLNDKSKLIRDTKNDSVWYFARVRDEAPAATLSATTRQASSSSTVVSPLIAEDLAPRCFYDQLHHFGSGCASLDPKSNSYQPLAGVMQSQHVFKKYTIVKFMETHFINYSGVPREESPSVASALKDVFLEAHEDIFASSGASGSATLSSEHCDGNQMITFVKEAAVLPVTTLLQDSSMKLQDLYGASFHRVPLMAVARFSDLSFQTSLSAPCPSPLCMTPQVFGIKGASAVSMWKLDLILYQEMRLAVIFRADDDVFALSMHDVKTMKRRGFGGGVVFTASASYPSQLTAINIPETTMMLIVAALRRVHCPEELISLLTISL